MCTWSRLAVHNAPVIGWGRLLTLRKVVRQRCALLRDDFDLQYIFIEVKKCLTPLNRLVEARETLYRGHVFFSLQNRRIFQCFHF